MDSVTGEDWDEEIFTEGVGVKWKNGQEGGEEKIFFHLPTPTNPLPVKHPVTIQDGGIKPIYLAFRSEIMHALQASYFPLLTIVIAPL